MSSSWVVAVVVCSVYARVSACVNGHSVQNESPLVQARQEGGALKGMKMPLYACTKVREAVGTT